MGHRQDPPSRIAILDDYQRVALDLADWRSLPPGTTVEVFSMPARDEDDLVRRLLPFDIVVAMRERTAFPATLIERLPNLELLASTGLRNAAIDLAACQRRGITVCGARGAPQGLASTVETAWALILALQKQLVASHNALHAGHWQPRLARPVAGRVLGLVGLGKVGQHMARIGQAFGMEVIAWSPNLTDERAQSAGARRVSKPALLATADVVSLHLVLSRSTAGVIGEAELAAMRRTAVLVNTSRAALIDEQALVGALQRGAIAGAGLDVFWQEPLPPDHALLALDNVVLSPHLGYVTEDNLAAFYGHVLDNIKAWMAGADVTPLQA